MATLAKKAPIEFTNAALDKIYSLLKANEAAHEGIFGVRIRIASRGCGGNSYKMEFCTKKEDYDDLFTFDCNEEAVNVLIDKKTMLSLFGTRVDYLQEKLKSGFEFYNGNETGRCGCGESFYTK